MRGGSIFTKNLTLLLRLIVTILLYQNCGGSGGSSDSGGNQSGSLNTNTIQSLIAYEDHLHSLLATSCSSCHRSDSQPLFSLDDAQASHDVLVNQNLVNFNSPRDSQLVRTVSRGHYGVSSFFVDYISDAVERWADDLRRGTDDDDGPDRPTGPEPLVDPVFSSIFRNILLPKCVKCHSPSGIRPQEDYSNYQRTRQTGGVVPGNSGSSRLYRSCLDRTMPDDAAPLNQNQLDALRDWIDMGAADD